MLSDIQPSSFKSLLRPLPASDLHFHPCPATSIAPTCNLQAPFFSEHHHRYSLGSATTRQQRHHHHIPISALARTNPTYMSTDLIAMHLAQISNYITSLPPSLYLTNWCEFCTLFTPRIKFCAAGVCDEPGISTWTPFTRDQQRLDSALAKWS